MYQSFHPAEESDAPEPGPGASDPREWGARLPLAAHLADAVPGPELAADLHAIAPADADDAALVEMVAAWERMVAWATAGQARVIAEMVERAGSRFEFVGDEVAAALCVSRRAGENKLDLALGLRALPRVADALAGGGVDARKAEALVRETDHLDPEEAAGLVDLVLDRAGQMTVPQLRAALRRAELARDPAAAAIRHEKARAQRSVRMVPAPDCMAWIHAFLPAEGAMRVMTGLDAVAAPCTPGDDRPIDARRADALVDLVGAVLDTGVGPGGVALARQQRRRPHLQVLVAAATLARADDAPAELVGYGPVTADVARRIAAEADWHAVAVDPETGQRAPAPGLSYRPSAALIDAVVARDVTCRFPGCRVPASRCDIDHIIPFHPRRPAAEQTRLDNLEALCRHHHRMKTFGGWHPEVDGQGRTVWASRTGQVRIRDPEPLPIVREPLPTEVEGPTASEPDG